MFRCFKGAHLRRKIQLEGCGVRQNMAGLPKSKEGYKVNREVELER